MVFSESKANRKSEVLVVSSDAGPPRLDFALTRRRRGTFSSFDSDGDLYPRATRSSHDLFSQALDRIDLADSDSEWGAVRARARENNNREGLADLIDFLRTTSPPPEFPSQSVFDEDNADAQEPERWRLFKKLRRPRTRARSESPVRRPLTAGLPNSAVASKTSSGNSHIAISIPLEYCHVGPDSDWALAIFNATPPLPPTPPVRRSEEDINGAARPYASDRTVTVLKTVSEKGSASTINTVNTMSTKRTKGSVSIWPKINPSPMSPPRTPYTTPPGSLRGRSLTRKTHDRMPLPPPHYAELPASPVPPSRSADDGLDRKYRTGKDGDHGVSLASHTQKVKTPPKRPENISLPSRKSSVKIARPGAETALGNQRSIDSMIGTVSKRESVTLDGPQLSPGVNSDAPSISPSIATTELSEPVISSARSAKAYSTASIVLQDPSTTPRQSFTIRPGSSDTAQTTLVNESVTSRNPSTRTAASRQSRKERVKSLKQRDMEALKALTKPLRPDEDGEITPRPGTCDTVISSLRLPSRDGTFGDTNHFSPPAIQTKLSATNLANMARLQGISSHHGPNGASAKISNWQATQQAETPGWETASENPTPGWETARETPDISHGEESQWTPINTSSDTFENGVSRYSTISSEPPRRWGSFRRTSWASSVPLLDRIGSFAPSDASFTQTVAMGNSYRMSRADSATLSPIDADRLSANDSCIISPGVRAKKSPAKNDQSFAGSIAAFPKPGSGPRLSAIMPVAEVVPSIPVDERWSASTLNSPMTVVEVSHPPFSSRQTPVRNSNQIARSHASGNSNVGRPSGQRSRDSASEDGDGDETATLRPKSRSEEDDSLNLLTMSASQLRAHYANLRSARVNDLAHEMLRNQERLELRMDQQERNQKLFIERLEQCMSALRNMPGSPFTGPRSLDWPIEDDFIYDEQSSSRDQRHNVRGRRTSRHRSQNRSQRESRSRRRAVENTDDFDDFDGEFVNSRPRRSSTSHSTPRRGRTRRQEPGLVQSLPTRGGLDDMEPLIRELQLASRLSWEAERTARNETQRPGDPNAYNYMM
ncbi:hypothetical protein CCHL11_00636 [Colletotrichum chlorophyti]|uniref:Uncharacterized protein n=1 Tax=Colletotrichum chlorophyti TaxID=708187 RepID=A0A1Q8S588_9PEZI|nr:hypothetical protein CCHL11_00636 [Colletotrichum chlorophyti]